MNPRSSVSRAQEHWPRLRICKYGQRLRRLHTSTLVPHLLPQDWHHPEESLKNGGNARHKYIACTYCLRALSGEISRVLISTIATAAAMSLATQTIRSIPQFMNRAIGPVFQQWRAFTRGVFRSPPRWKAHATPSGTLGKAEANGVVCLPDSQTCSVRCGNLVDVWKVFFVVQWLKRVVTSCRNHTVMD